MLRALLTFIGISLSSIALASTDGMQLMYITAGSGDWEADLVPIYTISTPYQNIKRFWVITINKNSKVPWDARNTLVQVDCKEKTMQNLQAMWYLRGKIKYTDNTPQKIFYIAPGTTGETFGELVCTIDSANIDSFKPFTDRLGMYPTDLASLVPMVQTILVNAYK